MELTGLLQMAPFRGMKEEELVAFLFGLPNSLKHFEPGDIIARQGDLCKKGCTFLHREVYGRE